MDRGGLPGCRCSPQADAGSGCVGRWSDRPRVPPRERARREELENKKPDGNLARRDESSIWRLAR